MSSARFPPTLSDRLREILLNDWKGRVDPIERAKLSRYGVFREDGKDWSCEYVRRKYFGDLFHTHMSPAQMFEEGLPSELDLLKARFLADKMGTIEGIFTIEPHRVSY